MFRHKGEYRSDINGEWMFDAMPVWSINVNKENCFLLMASERECQRLQRSQWLNISHTLYPNRLRLSQIHYSKRFLEDQYIVVPPKLKKEEVSGQADVLVVEGVRFINGFRRVARLSNEKGVVNK